MHAVHTYIIYSFIVRQFCSISKCLMLVSLLQTQKLKLPSAEYWPREQNHSNHGQLDILIFNSSIHCDSYRGYNLSLLIDWGNVRNSGENVLICFGLEMMER